MRSVNNEKIIGRDDCMVGVGGCRLCMILIL
jgi:hypothetical protein